MVIRWLIQCREPTTGLSPRCSDATMSREAKNRPGAPGSQPGHYSDRFLAKRRSIGTSASSGTCSQRISRP